MNGCLFLWQPCRLLADLMASHVFLFVFWGASVLVQAEDPDLPAFYFDPVINPISAFRSTRQTGWEEEEDDDGDWEVSYITRPLGLHQHVVVALWYKKLFLCQSSSHNSHLLSQKRKCKKYVAASLPFWPPTGVRTRLDFSMFMKLIYSTHTFTCCHVALPQRRQPSAQTTESIATQLK